MLDVRLLLANHALPISATASKCVLPILAPIIYLMETKEQVHLSRLKKRYAWPTPSWCPPFATNGRLASAIWMPQSSHYRGCLCPASSLPASQRTVFPKAPQLCLSNYFWGANNAPATNTPIGCQAQSTTDAQKNEEFHPNMPPSICLFKCFIEISPIHGKLINQTSSTRAHDVKYGLIFTIFSIINAFWPLSKFSARRTFPLRRHDAIWPSSPLRPLVESWALRHHEGMMAFRLLASARRVGSS